MEFDAGKEREHYGIIFSVIGIILNVALFAGKYMAGMLSGSIAIMADAFNNISDAGSSFMTLAGFLYAAKKPDNEHPFGHGRFEYISGFVVSVTIMLMAFELGKSSVKKIFHPEEIETQTVVIVILIVSIVIKLIMVMYNRVVGNRIGSAAMKATAVDSLSDSIATGVVLIGVFVMKYTGVNIDGAAGLFVALFILAAGIKSAKETMGLLMGQPPSEDFVSAVQSIVLSHCEILGIHDLVVHDYGPGRIMISLHAEVPGDSNIFMIHDVIDSAEKELKEKLGCEAIIHMDPMETDNEKTNEMRERVANVISGVDGRISIHDFRMVQGETHTNLIFDAVVPYSVKKSDTVIRKEMIAAIKAIDERLEPVITIDKSFVK